MTFTRMALALAVFALPLAGKNAFAGEVPTLCYPDCSPPQKAIWTAFQSGTPIRGAQVPTLFSGECFHTGPYDPNHAHHAVAVFDRYKDGVVYGGSFSFFAPNDPYAGLSLADAKAQGLIRYEDKFLLQRFTDHDEADLNPDRPPIWRYWFRESPDGRDLYVLGEWGTSQEIYCRLPRHAAP